VKAQETVDTLLFPARVFSRVQTNLYAESEGVIRSLPVNVGGRIKANGTLAVIQNTDPVYHYAPVRIFTPVGGVVSALEVRLGTHVTKSQLLGTVTDPSKLRLAIEVPAQDLASIHAGMLGEFRSPTLLKNPEVKVIGLSPMVDPKTGTASAELELTKGETLPAGTVGQISLKANAHSAITIPEDAIQYREGKPIVRVLADKIVRNRDIELGVSRRGNVEIKAGLKPGESIVLRASRYVSDGETVVVEEKSL
jgi:RND family efflux transporter MFP subunit